MRRSSFVRRIDWLMVAIILLLMIVGLVVLSAYSPQGEAQPAPFFTPVVRVQLQWYLLGLALFFFVAYLDYNKLREWTWLLYLLILIALAGLFFTESVQRVHRWYRLPFLKVSLQPSEPAKLVVVIALSWFLERERTASYSLKTVFKALCIVALPFALIFKQPDLGTSLILCPITLAMFYLGDVHPPFVRAMTGFSLLGLALIGSLFLGLISKEQIRPYAIHFLKEYQFDRLDPRSHQQQAAATAIAMGGINGVGWRQSHYAAAGFLPTPYTDSVFPAFGEEFGLLGLLLLLGLFYALIYRCYRIALFAKDPFGRLLAAGISTYLAVHLLINVGMMSGFLPITGVPLILITYGGSSVLVTLIALGILQSIYTRRFMF